ncbi:inositol monophosphatase family protein [Salinibacter altiplanensis]|uniref:inositol monophosphatase family protein n=1 Tax=Salinibacter altiplanensis TaxID=1803181 RepID=UPI000C9F3773|nr:inositol monophosphatase family protein [Salinibacter altiplanensis]
MSSLASELDLALTLARIAEGEILPRFRTVSVAHKPDGTEVTEADREAERAMREHLADERPDHAVLGEEFGKGGPDDARYQWVLDPVDGTAGFTIGMPLFGTLVGLLEEGTPVVGVIHFPALDETVYAARGEGCRFRTAESEHAVSTDPVESLDAATVTTTALHSSDVTAEDDQTPYRLTELVRRAGKFRFVTDCTQHALVARGRTHAAVDTLMRPWDVAALVPCVREAGGVAQPLDPDADDIVFGGSLVTAGSAALLDTVRNLLQPDTNGVSHLG